MAYDRQGDWSRTVAAARARDGGRIPFLLPDPAREGDRDERPHSDRAPALDRRRPRLSGARPASPPFARRAATRPVSPQRARAAAIDSAVIAHSRRSSRLRDRQRRHQDDDVAERADDRAAPARLERDPVAEPQRRVVLAEVDPDHQPPAAHLGHLVIASTSASSSCRSRIFGCSRTRVSLALEASRGWRSPPRRRADCRCRCGRGRRSGTPRGRRGTPRRSARSQRRGERQVAAGQALGQAEQVGGDPLLLAGEHRPGAPEPGRDLVADQQHAVARRRARAPPRR